MKRKTLKEKRTALKMMMEGKSQKEVCRHLNISEATFSIWIRSEDAKQIRAELLAVLDVHFEFDSATHGYR